MTKKCPICHTVDIRETIEVEHNIATLVCPLNLACCGNCGSLYYTDEEPVIGYIGDHDLSPMFKHYVQIGAGIQSLIAPLMRYEDLEGPFIDVGCGFGYTLKFWSEYNKGKALGLESASYGKYGAEILNVDIQDKYLTLDNYAEFGDAGTIFTSEVIEHVKNPSDFLKAMFLTLKENGRLILTTPSASVVDGEYNKSELLSAFSPGFHYFLLSEHSLHQMTLDVGFTDCVIQNTGHQLIMVAFKGSAGREEVKFDANIYLEYLKSLTLIDDVDVRGGAAYRLFRDSMNMGYIDVYAGYAFELLKDIAKKTYQLGYDWPDVDKYCAYDNFSDQISQFPAWYGPSLLYAANFAAIVDGRHDLRMRRLEAGLAVCAHDVDIAPQFSQEANSLIPILRDELARGQLETLLGHYSGDKRSNLEKYIKNNM